MHRISRMLIGALASSGLWMICSGAEREAEPLQVTSLLCYTPAPTVQALPVMVEEISVTGGTAPGGEPILALPEMEAGEDSPGFASTPDEAKVLETTIEGGMSIKNQTGYFVDAGKLLKSGPGLTLPAGEPQVLIIHTHSSEAYTQAGLDRYQPSDTNRTEDTQFNIVRIGDELADILGQEGLNVIHDRGIYDYPSYTGSYGRSGEAVARYLDSYPGIKLVLDVHRDALGSDTVVYKTMAEEDGVCASQVMLLVGSDDSGLEHPGWQQNMALAIYLQNAAVQRSPTLMRPISLVRERYNQHLSPGALIVEVGSAGNTLQEALAGVRLFGRAIGPALRELVEAESEEDE